MRSNDGQPSRSAKRFLAAALVVSLVTMMAIVLPEGTPADQGSQPASVAAGQLDVSGGAGDDSAHTCARLSGGELRCWGFGGNGRLGYANTETIGEDETPGSVAPVDLGSMGAEATSAGAFHTCAVVEDGRVLCWGFGGNGRLGYGNEQDVGDNEAPGSVGSVELGAGRSAKAISAGAGHTCAVLNDDSVRCWGFGDDGRLGTANETTIGDDEVPGSVRPVNLGEDRTAKAISVGENHTCAVLDDGSVRCWGVGGTGQLGYGNRTTIGDDEAPGSVKPVALGEGRTATAISAGDGHTCAVLDDGSVRCWGFGGNGRLGYGSMTTIGDDEQPDSVGPVDLGAPATAISAGDNHTCAVLADGSVRCWGSAADGRLGYANADDIGDDEAPSSVGPVDLGEGRTALAISAGGRHTCALLDDGTIRCWGDARLGALGYCNTDDIGDDEAPGSVGPVNTAGPAECASPEPDPSPGDPDPPPAPDTGSDSEPPEVNPADLRRRRYRRALSAQRLRRGEFRTCIERAARRRPTGRPRRPDQGRPRASEVDLGRAARRRCVRRHGRIPGRVRELEVRRRSRTKVVLSFRAPGTDGRRPPAARRYLIKQSQSPIRGRRAFRRAPALCEGRCGFDVTFVGARVRLTVTDLRPRTSYYYAVAARDNVSGRSGPRSRTVKARTR